VLGTDLNRTAVSMLPMFQETFGIRNRKLLRGPGVVVHVFNPSTREAEAGESYTEKPFLENPKKKKKNKLCRSPPRPSQRKHDQK
jgi:hypothetical protein